jgi:hypothetical protein
MSDITIPNPPKPDVFVIELFQFDETVDQYDAASFGYDNGVFHFVDRTGGVYFYNLSNLAKVHVVPIFEDRRTFDQVEAMWLDGTGRS